VDTLHATVWGYCYKLYDTTGTTFIGWLPQDPNTSYPKMSYTVYVSSDSLLNTSIKSIPDGFSVAVYPNPAFDQFHLDLKTQEEDMYTITLFSAMGQSVKILFAGQTSGLSKDYDISNLEPGLYYIQVSANEKIKAIKLSIIK
jgi:hypothetical protein